LFVQRPLFIERQIHISRNKSPTPHLACGPMCPCRRANDSFGVKVWWSARLLYLDLCGSNDPQTSGKLARRAISRGHVPHTQL
jgi:hypothetical protein